MTYFLWAILNEKLNVIGWRVTSDPTPTHHKDERWLRVHTFDLTRRHDMQVEHDEKNGKLIITIDCNATNPPKSASGKTYLVASETSKNSGVSVKKKPLTVAVNAYVKAE